ncbi:helicase [Candidatus Falkowbacteria bacterium CG11_big_fil_rev_8_21_14_0_20_39_10]|uniref:Helicase n=1 Tax=Candidatus Falkowbacteria bacterium CG11_big_fil_rev_8_21_14_0_20_39_10 TaxID=1974570 RepID=A0A2M6K8J8_9BACT|nr:MAG: helicase [Candidatus Falkowbacteria bacterium CG11_big_fil_rev_8_21_14_0_20_39_10]
MTQGEAFEILKLGHNVFLTGPAGSGKTFLLNKYIGYLKKNNIDVAITASTGIAATHLNGRTIHSWCGMGIKEAMTDAEIKSLKEKEHLSARILYAKVLIIDEISMLNAGRLDLVDNICKAFRRDLRPFGGMQVILCGDFFQLPPVAKDGEDNRFVTESNIWNDMDIKSCYLEEQYRQEDKKFLRVLNDIRGNAVTTNTCSILKERLNKSISTKIKPTKLYTHNNNVNAENNFELNKLSGNEKIYEMCSEGVPHLVQSLKDSYCLSPEILRLKVDAIVMFVKNNFNRYYVNGTLGKVIGFDDDSNYPIVKTVLGYKIIAYPESWAIEEGNRIIASISQVPLRLAWAITVHKSQGMSLDCAEIDLSKAFERGMGYVALSRVRSLDGIKLIGINELALKVSGKAIKLDKELNAKSKKDLKGHQQLGKRIIKKMQKDFLKNNKDDNSSNIIFKIPF